MKFKDLYKTLEREKYYIFSHGDLLSFFKDEKKSTIKSLIYRWKNKGWICSLKKGLYEILYPRDFNIPDLYVANKLYSPSYVSLETALSNYSIIPEVSMAVTSITAKPTRRFRNKHGLFIYRTVRPCAFCGYYIQKYSEFNILIAEPEKALIDYLYFKMFRTKKIDIKEERFEKEVISKLDKKKLFRYAAMYNLNLKEIYACL